jgi:WD40 repeat protein
MTTPDIQGYTIEGLVAQGGFGAVYRAAQPGIGRQVAIKVILPQFAAIPTFIRRFEIEAQTVARLEHPHIVPLYDYWRDPGGAYLVMRWMPGGSLAHLLQAGPLPVSRALLFFEQVASALALAHRRGVLHRDIKPANLLLDGEGNGYLADFGIAQALADDDAPAAFTPGYAAPEQVRMEPLSPRSDLYSLALVLYEMLTGARAFGGASVSEQLRRQLEGELPSLVDTGLPAALNGVLKRALAHDPLERYADVPTFALAVRQALAAADGSVLLKPAEAVSENAYATALVELADRENPYKGLRAFQEADAADFFGRSAAVERLIARLVEPGPRLLAVVGPSGSGKSSLVRAGLLPALRRGALPGSASWYVAELVPGAQPFAELERALLAVAAQAPPDLLQRLQASRTGLSAVAKELLPPDPAAELVLLIDQFEELFTQVGDEQVRTAFLDLLHTAVNDPVARVRVVLTLRADFYDRPLLYPAFGALMRERTEVVLPLSPAELEEAISRPAQRAGATVAPELVAELVEEVATRPGALPLLQYALTELFAQRKGRLLTLAGYRAQGGLRGALARRADAIYESLDAESQEAARQLFLRLVIPGEGVEDTRRRARLSEFSTAHATDLHALRGFDQALEQFGAARLLTFDRDPLTRQPTVEVAHEALIRSWGRLRNWIDTGREQLRLQRAIASAAAEWRANERDPSFLARGARLSQFMALAPASETATIALNVDEQAFLEASSAREQAEVESRELARQNELVQAQALANAERQRAEEQAAASQRLRRRAILLGLALVVAVLAFATAGWLGLEAQRNAGIAASERDRAERELVVADAQRLAFAAQGLPERAFETRLLLAIEAARRDRNLVTERVLRDAFARADWATTVLSHTEPLVGASFSRDGGLITTAHGTSLTVWDRTGKQRFTFSEHAERIRTSMTLPGDQQLITGDQVGTLRLFDISAGLLTERQAHESAVIQVDYSPAAQLVVSTGEDGAVRLWSAVLEEVATLSGHQGAVYRAVFSDDGNLLATVGEDGSLRVWNSDGRPVAALQASEAAMTRADWSPDGQLLVAGSEDGKTRVWEVATLLRDGDEAQPFATVGSASAAVTVLEFRSDSRYLLIGTFSGSLQIYSVADLEATGDEALAVAAYYSISSQLLTAGFNPDGSRIVAVDSDDYPVVLGFNPNTSLLSPLATLYGHSGAAVTARWSPDGKLVLSAGDDGTARIWSNVAPPLLQDPTPRDYQLAVTPDERYLLTTYRTGAADDPGRTQLWDGEGALIAELGGASTAAAFAEQDDLIVTGEMSGTMSLWRVDGTMVAELAGHSDIVRAIRFSADGERIISASDDGSARIWDRQGQQIAVLEHGTTEVWRAAWSPDRTRIVTAASDGARLWDGEGRLLKTLAGHNGQVDVALFSPDGSRIATGSSDDTARLWDAEGNLIAVLQHNDDVFELAFSDDSTQLMTSSADTTAKVWDRDGALLDVLQHRTYVARGGFTADGAYYITEAMETVHLWNSEGIEIATFEGGSSLNRNVYLADEGQTLVIVRNGIRHEHPIDLDRLQQAAECRVGRDLNAEEIATYQVSQPLRYSFVARECPPSPR